MTTVVWHGKTRTFAVDAMGTFQRNFEPILHNEHAYKIVDLVPLKLIDRYGERLYAAAVSGNVNGINSLLKFLIETLGEWKSMANVVKNIGGTFLSPAQGACAVVITNKAAYRVTMETGVKIDKFELDAFISIGSGKWSAITAYRVFGVSARDAVLSATVCDEGTGFMVMTAQVTSKGLTGHHGEYFNDMNAEILKIRKKVGTHTAVDTVKKQLSLENRFGTGDNIVSITRLQKIRESELTKRKEKTSGKKPLKEPYGVEEFKKDMERSVEVVVPANTRKSAVRPIVPKKKSTAGKKKPKK
jgi:hypothetical protein